MIQLSILKLSYSRGANLPSRKPIQGGHVVREVRDGHGGSGRAKSGQGDQGDGQGQECGSGRIFKKCFKVMAEFRHYATLPNIFEKKFPSVSKVVP